MILEGNSEIIQHCKTVNLKANVLATIVEFTNGTCLVITCNNIAIYKDLCSTEDPLGNGLIDQVDIPEFQTPDFETGFVKSYQAGFIKLIDERAILIMPSHIQLFSSNIDALNNQNEIAKLNFLG